MGLIKHKRFRQLEGACEPLELTDPLPEAGRKIVSRNGLALIQAATAYADDDSDSDDKISLNRMQDTTRRAHHLFTALDDCYTNKVHKKITRPLAALVQRVEAVQQLRTLSLDMAQSGAPHEEEFVDIAADLARAEARLETWLASKKFRKLIKQVSKFARKAGKGSRTLDDDTAPVEVRHLAPVILHEHLARVRAYDAAVDDLDEAALQSLYMDVLYLQDVITYFHPLLGASIEHVEEKIARLKEPLATVSQIAFARMAFDEEETDYIEELSAQGQKVLAAIPDLWASFNTRTNLRKFADALLVLR